MDKAGWSVAEGPGPKGRRVLAERVFRPGEVVIEDQAYAFALITDQLGSWCDCCLQPITHPLRCSACKAACYVSKEHQARAWRAGHREECTTLRSCAPHVPPTAVRLALRCALLHWKAMQAAARGGDNEQAGSRHDELPGLQHHWQELQDGSKVEFAQMGAMAHKLLCVAAPEAAEAVGPRDLALLIARFGCNSHTISDDELQPVAVGIFPLGAMVNHDCSPNTVHAFSGSRMLFRAVRVIEAGEEVTTAYAELAAPRWERRQALLRHHLFDIDAAMLAESGAAAEAAAAAASGLQGIASQGGGQPATAVQAALQCLPQQPLVATLPLAEGVGELRLYAGQLPPWPHDGADPALTVVLLAAAADASGDGGTSSTWGGMWGSLQQADSSATAASQSFGVDELLEASGDAVPGAAGSNGTRGHAAAGGAAQQQQQPLIHCWSPAAEEQQQQRQHAAMEQLAQRYAAALQLQQCLDSLLTNGRAAAAVQQLALALQALSGLPPASSAGRGSGSASLALGPRHILRMRLLADLHRAAVAAGQWEAALKAAYQLLPLYQQAYQPVWPPVGLLWASIAKLEHLREAPAKALAAAEQALRILAATHGSGGTVVEQMRRVQLEARQEMQHRQLAALGAAAAAEADD